MHTIRQQMIEALRQEELDALELSGLLGIPEREVYNHLPHLARTLAAAGMTLRISPYRCLSCQYTFTDRGRFDRPSRCPRCRKSHIRLATYTID